MAPEKKISAEELFESVCSLKAAGTQMQLQDGESGFDPEMQKILSQITSKKYAESIANCQNLCFLQRTRRRTYGRTRRRRSSSAAAAETPLPLRTLCSNSSRCAIDICKSKNVAIYLEMCP